MQATGFDRAHIDAHRGFMPLQLRPLDLQGHKCNSRICPHSETERKAYPCAPGYVSDRLHGVRFIFSCGSWSCEFCGAGKRGAFYERLRWYLQVSKYQSGAVSSRSWLITLTFRARCDQGCSQPRCKPANAGNSPDHNAP